MIICLIGPSAAGKSTVAKALQQRRPELFARVPVDYFLRPRPVGESIRGYRSRPFDYDWAALDALLRERGDGRTTPDFDFDSFRRRSDRGGLPVGTAPAYVLDGMRPHPQCDLLVLLELNRKIQLDRLADRDARWGTRLAARAGQLEATFAAGQAELPRQPDRRLPATDPVQVNVRRIVDLFAAERAGLPDSADPVSGRGVESGRWREPRADRGEDQQHEPGGHAGPGSCGRDIQ